MHPDDLIHVVLDALAELRRQADEAQPWLDYSQDPDDPKTSRTGYLAVLGVAENMFARILSTNGAAARLLDDALEGA